MAWRSYEQAIDELSRYPAGERLDLLAGKWSTDAEGLSQEDLRRLFVSVWLDSRDSIDDHRPDVVQMLRWIAPVRDVETYLDGTLTIYRAGTDPLGIRWTRDEAAAKVAAKQAGGLFRATVAADDVLAHFTGDGRDEELVNPNLLADVERVIS